MAAELATGKLFGKILISGLIHCRTGLHIGASRETMEIGGVDGPVIRDPLTREPYIPGSSIKGRLRSLAEKKAFAGKDFTETSLDQFFNKRVDRVRHHECNDVHCPVCRLFGTSQDKTVPQNRPARLFVEDAALTVESKRLLEEIDTGLYLTELKFENTLDRLTAAATPRQLERVPRGTRFNFQLIYNLDEPLTESPVRGDLEEIFSLLQLLNDDVLGGSGSRGSGRVELEELEVRYRPLAYYLPGEGQGEEVVYRQEEGQGLREFFTGVLVRLFGEGR
ncbi:MAG: type III-A CRISPR-associated RAMP protein Csm3 [bacterium]